MFVCAEGHVVGRVLPAVYAGFGWHGAGSWSQRCAAAVQACFAQNRAAVQGAGLQCRHALRRTVQQGRGLCSCADKVVSRWQAEHKQAQRCTSRWATAHHIHTALIQAHTCTQAHVPHTSIHTQHEHMPARRCWARRRRCHGCGQSWAAKPRMRHQRAPRWPSCRQTRVPRTPSCASCATRSRRWRAS